MYNSWKLKKPRLFSYYKEHPSFFNENGPCQVKNNSVLIVENGTLACLSLSHLLRFLLGQKSHKGKTKINRSVRKSRFFLEIHPEKT